MRRQGTFKVLIMAITDAVLALVRAVVFVYDVVTYPVYALINPPWNEMQKDKQPLGQVLTATIKLRRRVIQGSYESDIRRMYEELA